MRNFQSLVFCAAVITFKQIQLSGGTLNIQNIQNFSTCSYPAPPTIIEGKSLSECAWLCSNHPNCPYFSFKVDGSVLKCRVCTSSSEPYSSHGWKLFSVSNDATTTLPSTSISTLITTGASHEVKSTLPSNDTSIPTYAPQQFTSAVVKTNLAMSLPFNLCDLLRKQPGYEAAKSLLWKDISIAISAEKFTQMHNVTFTSSFDNYQELFETSNETLKCPVNFTVNATFRNVNHSSILNYRESLSQSVLGRGMAGAAGDAITTTGMFPIGSKEVTFWSYLSSHSTSMIPLDYPNSNSGKTTTFLVKRPSLPDHLTKTDAGIIVAGVLIPTLLIIIGSVIAVIHVKRSKKRQEFVRVPRIDPLMLSYDIHSCSGINGCFSDVETGDTFSVAKYDESMVMCHDISYVGNFSMISMYSEKQYFVAIHNMFYHKRLANMYSLRHPSVARLYGIATYKNDPSKLDLVVECSSTSLESSFKQLMSMIITEIKKKNQDKALQGSSRIDSTDKCNIDELLTSLICEFCLAFMYQLATVVGYLHKSSFIHGNLCPRSVKLKNLNLDEIQLGHSDKYIGSCIQFMICDPILDIRKSNSFVHTNFTAPELKKKLKQVPNHSQSLSSIFLPYLASPLTKEVDIYALGKLYQFISRTAQECIPKLNSMNTKLVSLCCSHLPKDRPTVDQILQSMMKFEQILKYTNSDMVSLHSIYESLEDIDDENRKAMEKTGSKYFV